MTLQHDESLFNLLVNFILKTSILLFTEDSKLGEQIMYSCSPCLGSLQWHESTWAFTAWSSPLPKPSYGAICRGFNKVAPISLFPGKVYQTLLPLDAATFTCVNSLSSRLTVQGNRSVQKERSKATSFPISDHWVQMNNGIGGLVLKKTMDLSMGGPMRIKGVWESSRKIHGGEDASIFGCLECPTRKTKSEKRVGGTESNSCWFRGWPEGQRCQFANMILYLSSFSVRWTDRKDQPQVS